MLTVVALTGCVALKPAQPAHSTVLFSVVLKGDAPRERPLSGLVVIVDEQPASEGLRFAFAPYTRIPGHYTTFLVRLDLPPGHHRLSRLSGVTASGVLLPEFDASPQVTFDARSKTTDYLGHLELSSATAVGTAADAIRAVLADAYEDDLPNFVQAWPTLRGHPVRRRAPQKITAVALEPRAGVQPISTDPSEGSNDEPGHAAPLDASAAVGLPAGARPAFRSFLMTAYPRAFAVAASGSTGTAFGGADVIKRALRNCQRAQPLPQKSACRLFALDDTLISAVQMPPRAGRK